MSDRKRAQSSALAIGEALKNSARFIAVEFYTDRGEREVVAVPSEEFLQPKNVARFLVRNGFPLGDAHAAAADLCEQVSRGSLPRIIIPDGSGWLPDFSAYIYGEEVLGEPTTPVVLPTDYLKRLATQDLAIAKSLGSTEDWRDAMVGLPVHSYVITFAICVGFASVMAGPLNCRPALYNIFGDSGDGKTVALRTGWSPFGRCGEADLPNWDATRAGLEDVLRAATDILVPIDELSFVTDKEQAQILAKLTYSVGAGRTRTLASTWSGAVGGARLRGTRFVLSTGEKSLGDTRQIAGTHRQKGEVVRAIDVPSDAGYGAGILRSRPDHHTDGSYVRSIEDACTANYGLAGRQFIKYLLKTPSWKDDAKRRMRRFDSQVEVGSNRVDVRFANRFNIIYAAGRAAIDAGVLDWDTEEFGHAIGRIYDKARDCLPKQFAERDRAIDRLRNAIRDSEIIDAPRGKEIDQSTYDRAVAFGRDGKLVVKTEAMDDACGNRRVRDQVIEELIRHKLLIPDANGISTQQPSIGGDVAGRRARYYVLRKEFLGRDD